MSEIFPLTSLENLATLARRAAADSELLLQCVRAMREALSEHTTAEVRAKMAGLDKPGRQIPVRRLFSRVLVHPGGICEPFGV